MILMMFGFVCKMQGAPTGISVWGGVSGICFDVHV